MIYSILKISARLALRIYCADIIIHDKNILRQQGPFLFAANHPNSFLDALIVAAHTSRKTYILVRGDVFKNKWADLFLRYLGCVPIYRGRDGRSMLGQNTLSFQECLTIFNAGDNVLIFSEGNCENEWRLRPLGKGTARLAFMSRKQQIQVIPTGFTYSHFKGVGKRAILFTGKAISPGTDPGAEQRHLRAFNRELEKQLSGLILEFSGNARQMEAFRLLIESAPFTGKDPDREIFSALQQHVADLAAGDQPRRKVRPLLFLKKIILFPFALAGWLLHAPFYYPVKMLARAKTKDTVYYDSVLFGLLFLLYPFYLILLAAALMPATNNKWCGLVIVIAPLLAFLTVKSGIRKNQ